MLQELTSDQFRERYPNEKATEFVHVAADACSHNTCQKMQTLVTGTARCVWAAKNRETGEYMGIFMDLTMIMGIPIVAEGNAFAISDNEKEMSDWCEKHERESKMERIIDKTEQSQLQKDMFPSSSQTIS